MRWFVTVLLGVLAFLGVGFYFAQDRIVQELNPPPPRAATLDRLSSLGDPNAIRKLTLTRDGQAPLTLLRGDDGTWSQPGNWPLRVSEVAVLTNTLAGLQPRFAPMPYTEADAAKYGLAPEQKPITIKLDVQQDSITRSVQLKIGQPTSSSIDNALQAPCYLRCDDEPEVVQLGPEIYARLARSPEVYRRRQLVPDVERVKLPAEPGERSARSPLLGDAYRSVSFTSFAGSKVGLGGSENSKPTKVTFTRIAPTPTPRRDPDRPNAEPVLSLDRLAEAWELQLEGSGTPIVDRPEPAKLRRVLVAVADLWAEGFVPVADATPEKTGLNQPTRTITLNRADGKIITVAIGKVLRTKLKLEDAPPPSFPGQPPLPPKATTEEYSAAQILGNDLVFELRTDKLNELIPAEPYELRDPILARWATSDVQEVTLTTKGQSPIELTKKPGDPNAERADERNDRWYIGGRLAETTRITELLDALSRTEAKTKDAVIDAANEEQLKAAGLTNPDGKFTVTLRVQPRSAPGDVPLPPREVRYNFGEKNTETKKIASRVSGRERVNLLEDTITEYLERPALAYRSRTLFDLAGRTLNTLQVTTASEPYTLARPSKEAADADAWEFTAPIRTRADASKVNTLTQTFTSLQAVEFIDEAPSAEALEQTYGLAKPRFRIELKFTGFNPTTHTLDLGNPREGKEELYARLNEGNVFTVAKSTLESLEPGPVALLAPELWSIPTSQIQSIAITRNAEPSYKLSQPTPNTWELSGPFSAKLPTTSIEALVQSLGTLKVSKYETLTAKDLAPFGLDQPTVKVTLTTSDPATPERTLLLGKATADDARFAKLDGADHPSIFTLPIDLVRLLDVPPLNRLDKNLLAVDPAKLSKLTLKAGQPDAIQLLKNDGQWRIEGESFSVDAPTAEGLAILVTRPPAGRLVAYGDSTNWAVYGLDAPTVIEFELETTPPEAPERHRLQLGKVEANGERYFRVDDGFAVGVLPARVADVLAATKLDLVDRTLIQFDPKQLLSITRTSEPATLELVNETVGWRIVKPAAYKADATLLDRLTAELANLRAERIVALTLEGSDAEAAYGLGAEATTLLLKLNKNDQEQTIKLLVGKPVDVEKPDGERYATVDGKLVGVVNPEVVRQILAKPIKFRDRTLAKFVDADIIELERGDRKATFSKVNGTWKLTKPTTADAEQADLDELINELATLKADEWIADSPDDLVNFGLKEPKLKYTLRTAQDTVLALHLGTTEPESGRIHAKLADGTLVAVLSEALSKRLLGEFRKRDIWSSADAALVETIVISSDTANQILKKTALGWIDTKKPAEALPAEEMTKLLSTFTGLKAERYIADTKPDLALYGLAKPSRVIVVTMAGGKSFTLNIGGPEGTSDGKQRYAQAEGADAVFLLSEADTATLMSTAR